MKPEWKHFVFVLSRNVYGHNDKVALKIINLDVEYFKQSFP